MRGSAPDAQVWRIGNDDGPLRDARPEHREHSDDGNDPNPGSCALGVFAYLAGRTRRARQSSQHRFEKRATRTGTNPHLQHVWPPIPPVRRSAAMGMVHKPVTPNGGDDLKDLCRRLARAPAGGEESTAQAACNRGDAPDTRRRHTID